MSISKISIFLALTNETFARLPVVSSRFNTFIGMMREMHDFLNSIIDHHIEQLEGVDVSFLKLAILY